MGNHPDSTLLWGQCGQRFFGQNRLGRVHRPTVPTSDLDLTSVHIVLNQHIVQVMHRLVVITCLKGGV